MTEHNRVAVIFVLGTTQTLGWASSFYLPAILGDRIAEDLAMSSTWFFAAFSAALVVSALVGPRAGRTVDAVGGREVLAVSNVVLAAGLTILALAHSQVMLWLPGWFSESAWGLAYTTRHLPRSAGFRGGSQFRHHGHYLACRIREHGRLPSHRMGSQ
jgi:hypothetical protein